MGREGVVAGAPRCRVAPPIASVTRRSRGRPESPGLRRRAGTLGDQRQRAASSSVGPGMGERRDAFHCSDLSSGPPRSSPDDTGGVAVSAVLAPSGAGTDGSASPGPRDPAIQAGYATLLSGYAVLAGVLSWAIRRRGFRVAALQPFELLSYGLATQHLARLITKDAITSVVRSPFTRYEETAGEGEVNEEVVGGGLRHAVGELISCPFCIGQWVATALVAGRVAMPQLTTAVVSVSAVARLGDYLQLLYSFAREKG